MSGKIGNITSVTNKNGIGIVSSSGMSNETLYFTDFYDERAIDRFIKSTESMIRKSREYLGYIHEIHESISELNYDNIMSNIGSYETAIEMHHYPISLYEIVEIVLNHSSLNNKLVTSFSLAKEVMELHYQHYIGLVPLCETTHQLAHVNGLFLSSKQIFGNYKKFIEIYKDSIPVRTLNKIAEIEKRTLNNDPSDPSGMFK